MKRAVNTACTCEHGNHQKSNFVHMHYNEKREEKQTWEKQY